MKGEDIERRCSKSEHHHEQQEILQAVDEGCMVGGYEIDNCSRNAVILIIDVLMWPEAEMTGETSDAVG